MTVRRCIPWPDKRLQTPAMPVDGITDEVRAVWRDMVDTMEAMPGYGLGAPQIGVMLRLAVVDCSEARGQAVLMANPEILHASIQFRDHEEASPNLPGGWLGRVVCCMASPTPGAAHRYPGCPPRRKRHGLPQHHCSGGRRTCPRAQGIGAAQA